MQNDIILFLSYFSPPMGFKQNDHQVGARRTRSDLPSGTGEGPWSGVEGCSGAVLSREVTQ